jgi:hypothetical protein
MDVIVMSISDIAAVGERSAQLGRYRVQLKAGDIEQILDYRVDLSDGGQSLSWTPRDSILADPRVDVLLSAAVSDLVVAFHRGADIDFPRRIAPPHVASDTVVVRL